MRKTAALRAFERGKTWRTIRGMLRRVAIRATDGARWLLAGATDEAGDVEEIPAEPFQGIGFVARPAGAAEGILATVSASTNHTVLIAVRDEATNRAVVARVGLDTGETLVHNGARILKLCATGEVLVGDPEGDFREVALADHKHDLPPMTTPAGPVTAANTQPMPPSPGQTGPSSSNSTDTRVT